ncbi:Inner membrane protein YqiJ [Halioglobus japonicus]|nr:Inner membrane protein YqiJ [Halioglobus japonicus]
MLDFLTQPENSWFSIALVVMFGIALLEGLLSVLGFAMSSMLDGLLPEFDANLDTGDVNINPATGISRFLSWLRVGKVPVLMLLIVFLTGFGLSGLIFQSFLGATFGFLLPAYVAAIPALIVTLPVVRVVGGLIERFMPGDETEAVSDSSLVGRTAVVTLGTAKAGSPAQAKLKDRFGTAHYVMVEPDADEAQFTAGSEVLLVKKDGYVFRVIGVENQNLSDRAIAE